jgi:hypothetical protein
MAHGAGRGIRVGTIKVLVLAALGTLLGVAPAQSNWLGVYDERFGEDAHPLYVFGGVIRFGPQNDSPFLARLVGGMLELSNDTDPTTSRYFFIEPQHASQWLAAGGIAPAASVTVAGEFGEMPGVGLIYRVDPETHWFYAFLLGPGQAYGFYLIDGSGFNAVVTDTSAAIMEGQSNRLTITPEGTVMHLYINDQHVTSVDDARVNGVGVGFIAAGTGAFTFDDFELFVPR